jgi:hypothetical protein
MNKIITTLIILLSFLIYLDTSEAVCCTTGCYEYANQCCGDPEIGYPGCYDPARDLDGIEDPGDFACPEETIGECLKCECTSPTDCAWVDNLGGDCNGCEVTRDNQGLPIDSLCSSGCPSGQTKCADEICRPPECCNDISLCCLDENDGCCSPDSQKCDVDCIVNGISNDPDCGSGASCGDGSCSSTEDCNSCSLDCGVCDPNPVCGDNTCDPNESCSSCETDCGNCGNCLNSCGDGCCDSTENCNSCSLDCGTCAPNPVCGNNICEPNESPYSCSNDCGDFGSGYITDFDIINFKAIVGTFKGFSVNGLDHSVDFTEINNIFAKLIAASEPQEVITNSGETSYIDLDGDGTPDIFITINYIDGGTIADVTMGLNLVIIECTSAGQDCCHPYKDGTCDPDCVEELDPDCQTWCSSFGNDGCCNAEADGECDINCMQAVDLPDCEAYAYTFAPNDGCFPLIDSVCDLDCPLDVDPDCLVSPGNVDCSASDNGICEDFENCACDDCIDDPASVCVSGLFCCSSVCSGDLDEDLTCDYEDYCLQVFEEEQVDTDNDCYLNGARSDIFGYCGDVCDQENTCFDVYGDKQCCDDLPGSEGTGNFLGFTADCPNAGEGSLGCWSQCIETDAEGNIITYEIGQCIDGTRIITKLKNGIAIEKEEEPCTSIPLIPFYSNFSIIATLVILITYYFKRK